MVPLFVTLSGDCQGSQCLKFKLRHETQDAGQVQTLRLRLSEALNPQRYTLWYHSKDMIDYGLVVKLSLLKSNRQTAENFNASIVTIALQGSGCSLLFLFDGPANGV